MPPKMSADKFELKNSQVLLNRDNTIFRSPLRIENETIQIRDNQIAFRQFSIIWEGEDTRRKLTNAIQTNKFTLSGGITIEDWNFLDPDLVNLKMAVTFKPTFLSVKLDNIYHGDIQLGGMKIKGNYAIPLSYSAFKRLRDVAGTINEKGPLISGSLALSDGKINFPSLGKKPLKPSFLLNLKAKIRQGLFVDGGVFGAGIFSFANNFFLELKESPKNQPLGVSGSLNLLRISNELEIVDGSISFFDRIFRLLPEDEQRQYFKEETGKVSVNKLAFVTDFPKGLEHQKLIPVLDIKAVTFIETLSDAAELTDTQNVTTAALPEYKGVVMIFKGRIDELENSLVIEEYKVADPYASNINAEYVQRYELSFSQGDRADSNAQDGINLIMPQFLANPSEASFGKFGESQANNIFRSTVRPYEKRLARRIGLYDLRLDYNVGKALFDRSSTLDQDRNLFGLNMVANLVKEKLFFRVKTDLDLSSESRQSINSVQFTEFELTYLISRNISFNVNNITEYGEVSDFSPKMSFKLSHAF